MSYEGYTIYLCANGHKFSYDVYNDPFEYSGICPICVEKIAWRYGVDQTNGPGEEPVFDVHTYEERSSCEHCGATKAVKPATYKIPSNVGHLVDGVELHVPRCKVKLITSA